MQFSVLVILAIVHPSSLNLLTFSIVVGVSPDTDNAITKQSSLHLKFFGKNGSSI